MTLVRSLTSVLRKNHFYQDKQKNTQQGCTKEKHPYICKVNEMQKYRTITFYKDYFQVFFDKQSKKVKAKIVWTFDLVEDLERVPETYLKHIENTEGLY